MLHASVHTEVLLIYEPKLNVFQWKKRVEIPIYIDNMTFPEGKQIRFG